AARAGPQQALPYGRFGQRVDHAVGLGAASQRGHLAQLSGREITTDRAPRLAFVREPKYALGPVVQNPLVVGALNQRRVPVISIAGTAFGRLGSKIFRLPGPQVEAEDVARLR